MLETRNRMTAVWISIIFAGLVSVASGSGMDLALELFKNGDWKACHTECRRAIHTGSDAVEPRVLGAICELRLEREIDRNILVLVEVVREKDCAMALRNLAAYEAGRAEWEKGNPEKAYELFVFAYLNAVSEDLFLRAGCSLFLLLKEHSNLEDETSALALQLKSSRDLYDWDLQRECALEKDDRGSLLGMPGEWIVAIYRNQIAPAIGMRCSCVPSCSRYFLQACRKHGLLGFPIQADRFFREPSLVQQRANPVKVGGKTKYADPLTDHDFWMEGD